LDERKVQLFEESILRCMKAGVRVVILHSPYFYEYKGESTTTICIRNICLKHGVEFINDSQMPEFIGKSEFIYDALHLNETGANEFTSILVNQLKHDN
jgi:hypothetical protein